jgi:hypothetical protein
MKTHKIRHNGRESEVVDADTARGLLEALENAATELEFFGHMEATDAAAAALAKVNQEPEPASIERDKEAYRQTICCGKTWFYEDGEDTCGRCGGSLRWERLAKATPEPATAPEPEPRKPLEAADIPPGSVVRLPRWGAGIWESVTRVTAVDVTLIGVKSRTFWHLAKEGYQIKRPGEWWKQCSKPGEVA